MFRSCSEPNDIKSIGRLFDEFHENYQSPDSRCAQHADVEDAGGDGREWRVAVADGLLKALNMKALLLTEHCC